MIAFVFIVYHVFHMHGWFHFDWWKTGVAEPLGGAQFRAYNAASSLGAAMNGFVMPLLYAVGVLSCVFHLANGIWTMGITWGLWVSPAGQRRADLACIAFGIGLAVLSLVALFGAVNVDEAQAKIVEDRMYEAKAAAQEIAPDDGHRSPATSVSSASPGNENENEN
jgi:succinate dehydrogenase / fumarate reductase cytochrome b subunit